MKDILKGFIAFLALTFLCCALVGCCKSCKCKPCPGKPCPCCPCKDKCPCQPALCPQPCHPHAHPCRPNMPRAEQAIQARLKVSAELSERLHPARSAGRECTSSAKDSPDKELLAFPRPIKRWIHRHRHRHCRPCYRC